VSCQETQGLIHGYVDGELDLVRPLEIERHIEGCEVCSRAYRTQRDLKRALHSAPLFQCATGSSQAHRVVTPKSGRSRPGAPRLSLATHVEVGGCRGRPGPHRSDWLEFGDCFAPALWR
jgi:anti-sigma factor RsiW